MDDRAMALKQLTEKALAADDTNAIEKLKQTMK